jgi:hypothetical protein
LESGQTASFSIHKAAEITALPVDKIDQHCNQLELHMLDEFYQFAEANKNCHWIHWNMRDENYGFAAIKRRYQVLQGTHFKEMNQSKLHDLSRLLGEIYGWNYIGHPRIESLARKNNMTDTGFLTGAQEAEAWDNKKYLDLHRSTLRKVDLFSDIFWRLQSGSLKTDVGKWTLYIEHVKRHPAYTTIVVIGALGTALFGIWRASSVLTWAAIKSAFGFN